MQIGLDEQTVLPQLLLAGAMLQWVLRLKYLGVWIVAGKHLKVDQTKFLGSVFGLLQKCGSLSDEVKWNVLQHRCVPICYMESMY
jgi:hypothetical protein